MCTEPSRVSSPLPPLKGSSPLPPSPLPSSGNISSSRRIQSKPSSTAQSTGNTSAKAVRVRSTATETATATTMKNTFIPLSFDESDADLTPIPVHGYSHDDAGANTNTWRHHQAASGPSTMTFMTLPRTRSEESNSTAASRIVSANSFHSASNDCCGKPPITPTPYATTTAPSAFSTPAPRLPQDHSNIHFSDQGFGNLPRSDTPSLTMYSMHSMNSMNSTLQPKNACTFIASPSTSVSQEFSGMSLVLNHTNSTMTDQTMGSYSHGSDGLGKVTGDLAQHRKKRLERNRASARLSRRRRKQYLEVLEDRVKELSVIMDSGRRHHVAVALQTINQARLERLALAERELFAFTATATVPTSTTLLERHCQVLQTTLSSTAPQFKIVLEFQKEQLQTLVIPPHYKFILWMTLQNEPFFRGGRSSSERLSAARIGEKLLNAGNHNAGPCGGMWPLLCNEIGLSYDQEERIRQTQRKLLLEHPSWVERHAGEMCKQVVVATCRTLQGTLEKIHTREKTLMKVLTVEQRLRYWNWAQRHRDTLSRIAARERQKQFCPSGDLALQDITSQAFQKNNQLQHNAAHLHLLNQRLLKVAASSKLPPVSSVAPPHILKKLSRRPMFESLGSRTASLDKKNRDAENNTATSTSTSTSTSPTNKRTKLTKDSANANANAVDLMYAASQFEKQQLIPEVAQAQAAPFVAQILGPAGVKVRFATATTTTNNGIHVHVPQAPQPVSILPIANPIGPHSQQIASPMQSTFMHPQFKVSNPLDPDENLLPSTAPNFVPPPNTVAYSPHVMYSTSTMAPPQPQPQAPHGTVHAPPVQSQGLPPQPTEYFSFHTNEVRHNREISLLNSPLPTDQDDFMMAVFSSHPQHSRLPSQAQADDFLLQFAQDDDGWAIGDGFDLDVQN